MSAYLFVVKCPNCEPVVDLEPVVESRTCRTESSAIGRCPNCGQSFQASVFLRPVGDDAATARRRLSRKRRAA